MPIDWPRFVEIVRRHQRFVLTSHIRPDCDALGSELGMAGVLGAIGKDVRIVNGQSTPPNLLFIDPTGRLEAIGVDVQPAELADRDVLIVLDTSAWTQLGPMAEVVRSTRAKKIVLDHHVSSDDLGAEMFKDTEAEATGRLVLQAADQLGVAITPEIAMPLFAAISTDTGWFRFNSTTGDTMRAAGRLLDAGAKPGEVYRSLYEQDTLARLHLIGLALARARMEMNGRAIHTAILQEDFRTTGAVASDTEDIVNMTLQVGGVEVALMLVELASGGVKVSFRSRNPAIDCSTLAEKFQGGGHKAAAGATLFQPMPIAQAQVLEAVRAAMTYAAVK
ncbi:MAG TPA: bifunctional oligoribonuclease/PAP phosphatase NrnA [Pirellulales bacterium]|jgi:phosphoesterase RecJ-like protein|nr:bifunctional oligoribonuclease/PAP phosphatase NrnA [Pirellulales bacterium]